MEESFSETKRLMASWVCMRRAGGVYSSHVRLLSSTYLQACRPYDPLANILTSHRVDQPGWRWATGLRERQEGEDALTWACIGATAVPKTRRVHGDGASADVQRYDARVVVASGADDGWLGCRGVWTVRSWEDLEGAAISGDHRQSDVIRCNQWHSSPGRSSREPRADAIIGNQM